MRNFLYEEWKKLLRLKDLREDKDLTQQNIATILNVTQVAYSYYESEKRMIPINILKQLAKFYNTSTDYILGLTNEKKAYPRVKD